MTATSKFSCAQGCLLSLKRHRCRARCAQKPGINSVPPRGMEAAALKARCVIACRGRHGAGYLLKTDAPAKRLDKVAPAASNYSYPRKGMAMAARMDVPSARGRDDRSRYQSRPIANT